MEAHPTLGCIQDQSSWGWVLQITIRSCVNPSQCLNGCVPSFFRLEQNRVIGIRTLHAPDCLPFLAPSDGLLKWESTATYFHCAVKHRDRGRERLF